MITRVLRPDPEIHVTMKQAVTLGAAALALMLGASAAAAQSADTTHADSSHAEASGRPRRNPNVLTADEIAATHESSAYQAVARLRSRWLRERPGSDHDLSGDDVIQVYRNGQLAGGVEALREITADDVATIEWVPPIQSRTRFGPRASHGAIVVTDKH